MRQPRSICSPRYVLIDDVAQALGAGLGGKGQTALADLRRLFSTSDSEKLSTRRDGSDKLTWSASAQEFSSSRNFFQPRMIGGRQARQAQFIVAGVAAERTGAVADELGAALTEGG